jgi:lysyl endopeptidase
MRYKILIFVLGVVTFNLNAQIGKGGRPRLEPGNGNVKFISQVLKMPALPSTVMLDIAELQPNKGQPLRFAHPFFVTLTPENSGHWTVDSDRTKIWRLAIQSEGAYSLNLIFDRLFLVPGSSLYVFNADQSMILGAFTHENNSPTGIFATAPVEGDAIIVEYQEPSGIKNGSQIEIGAVNHDYLNIFNVLAPERMQFKRSGSCNPDFTCEIEDDWLLTGQSVVRIITDGNVLCTGTLINNTREDGTPYVLTAAHCLRNANSHQTAVFTFNYQSPNCDGRVEGSAIQTISGSSLRVYAETLDVALLEMSTVPPPSYRPVWAGWNRTGSPVGPVKSIHHPNGDVKKVATANANPTAVTFNFSSLNGNQFITNSHWLIAQWNSGTTEVGSSGAPLFDVFGRVIGSLSGGRANCTNPVEDYFSRINKAWSHFTDPSEQLATWLDPDGLNPQTLDTYNHSSNEFARISNFMRNDSAGMKWIVPGGGVWSGHNSRQDRGFADGYGIFETATLHGIYVMPAKSNTQSSQTVNIRLLTGLDKPTIEVYKKTGILLAQIRANREYLLMFDNPITISGNLWAEVELNYPTSVDSFALYQSVSNNERVVNSAWIRNVQNEWSLLTDRNTSLFNSSYWIDLLVTDMKMIDTANIIPPWSGFLVYPNPLPRSVKMNLIVPDAHGIAIMEVYTAMGEKALQNNIIVINGRGQVDFSGMIPGIYIVRIKYENKEYIQKIVVVSG